MQKQDYIILVTVHEEKNITKAAQKLFSSQPAVTYRLQKIEEEYNIKIFHREGNKLFFTSEGEYLVEFSKKMLFDLSKMEDYIKTLKKDSKGTIHLGVSSNFALYKLPPLIKRFLEIHSQTQVNVYTGWSSEIIQLIKKNEIQIGIVTGNYNWYDEKILLTEDPITIISKKPLDIKELPYLPMIYYQPNRVIGQTPEPTNPLARTIENWWQENYKIAPLIRMRLDKVETCKAMVENGLGFSIIPKSCLTEDDFFYTYDLKNDKNKLINRKTWLIFRKSTLELSSVNNFVTFMKMKASEENHF
ncbi:LysR family transcriptional regulator [Cytobacillus depressus]|uniref:LysR family transcriptional regulator n=1 Tax=Cytobacillus depressus TaxID=1602942 RepID=A0A6L3V7X1_9BACI|nr:LysR family transcriptional regulator [Cytobacillus depressus]KAB2336697.1 LysR family transcriptional regulator [Cytobacillus depressus]